MNWLSNGLLGRARRLAQPVVRDLFPSRGLSVLQCNQKSAGSCTPVKRLDADHITTRPEGYFLRGVRGLSTCPSHLDATTLERKIESSASISNDAKIRPGPDEGQDESPDGGILHDDTDVELFESTPPHLQQQHVRSSMVSGHTIFVATSVLTLCRLGV